MPEKKERIRSPEEAREFLLNHIRIEDLEPDSPASGPENQNTSPSTPEISPEILFDPTRHPDYQKQQRALRLEEGSDLPKQESRRYLF